MSDRDWLFRLQDMVDVLGRISRSLETLSFSDYCDNYDIQDALDRRLEILGEAARHIPDDFKDMHTNIPWHKIRGLRNIIAHEYVQLNRQLIWNTLTQDLPPLAVKLQALLKAQKA